MDKTQKSLIFFGNEQLCTGRNSGEAPILRSLIESGYSVNALVLNQKPTKSDDMDKLSVVRLAKENDIPIVFIGSKDNLFNILSKFPSNIGVLAAFGRIVSSEVLELFEYGIINVHPSLLPNYRGPTPIEQALLDQQTTTGVSVIKLAEKMDAGPIYSQETIKILSDDTKFTLANKLGNLGAKLILKDVDKILSGDLEPKAQDDSLASYCRLINKKDGEIDTNKDAHTLLGEIKAYADWPKSTYLYKNIKIIVLEGKAIDTESAPQSKLVKNDKKLLLGCKNSTLEIVRLQVEGKKPMDAKSFINGYSHLLD